MKIVRINNDLHFTWRFFLKADPAPVPYNLNGKDLKVVITNPFGSEMFPQFTTEGNAVYFSFLGKEQVETGVYTLTMLENPGKDGMRAIDKLSPFRLVERQESVVKNSGSPCDFPTLDIGVIELSSELTGANDYNDLINKPLINNEVLEGSKTPDELGLVGEAPNDGGQYVRERKNWTRKEKCPYTSLERICEYLYRVTFDRLPEDNGGESVVAGGCSSYVADGKLFTNLDWDYSCTAEFAIRTKDFEGTSFINGLNDGALDDKLIAQLPYRVRDGVNNYGIKVAAHILFNDWGWSGCGDRSVSLTRLPFLVLSKVKSMATISSDLDGVLNNLTSTAGLDALGYLIQVIVTDGTTTYALLPPLSDNQPYVLQDISTYPKITNFRWIGGATVVRADLQTRPTGVERYNLMPCDLSELRFTKAYETPDRLSEFIGLRGTTKESTDAELEAIYAVARQLYLDRARDGQTWQTMHSAVYGDRMEGLWIQENWNVNRIGVGDVTKAYVDGKASELAEAISQVLAYLKSEIDSLNERLKNYGDIIKMAVVDSVDYKTCGKPMFIECSTAGAPNASRIPNDWDDDEYGVWTGVPLAPHSFYYDITSKKVYFAPRCTNSTADWILLN